MLWEWLKQQESEAWMHLRMNCNWQCLVHRHYCWLHLQLEALWKLLEIPSPLQLENSPRPCVQTPSTIKWTFFKSKKTQKNKKKNPKTKNTMLTQNIHIYANIRVCIFLNPKYNLSKNCKNERFKTPKAFKPFTFPFIFLYSNWEAVGCNYVSKESLLTALAKKSAKYEVTLLYHVNESLSHWWIREQKYHDPLGLT